MTTQFRRYVEHDLDNREEPYYTVRTPEPVAFANDMHLPAENDFLTKVGDHHIGIIEEDELLRCNDCGQTIHVDESSTVFVEYVLGKFLDSPCVIW